MDVPLSALEHFSYCARQCALIHVEQTYDENLYTIRGQLAHERVHSELESVADGVRTVRAIPLWSERYGLTGKADAVEFHPQGPYPVEYKSGRPHGRHAAIQLCAQALCLEEMLGVEVRYGAIYFIAARKRLNVAIDASLRAQTEEVIRAVRTQLEEQVVPSAVNDGRCLNCSLKDSCLPGVVAEHGRLRLLQGTLFRPAPLASSGPEVGDA
jgi:CRISPR-associated exonuclease Cas4